MTSLAQDHGAQRLTPQQFGLIAEIAQREAGLVLVEAKSAMISSRLAKRLRAKGLRDLGSYCDLVSCDQGRDELPYMISALTTNVSHFFREAHHFDMLREKILPDLLATRGPSDPIRIWSAGCSNGQEIYSIAMTVLEMAPDAAARGLRILGTDIDLAVIRHARRGIYDAAQLNGVSPDRLERHFSKTGDGYAVRPHLREIIRINHLNLIQPWPMRTKFDVIFCRNVVIYFDEALQATLWRRFSDALRDDAWLFIGHSERVAASETMQLASCGLTAYRKTEGLSGPATSRTGN